MTAVLERATDADLLTLLERDYRRQLRWYPKPWRTAHGDALIGTLLDEADDTDRFTMEPGEWRHFAAAGLEARLDRFAPRRVRDAAATVLLSAGVGIALTTFVVESWAPWSTGEDGRIRAFGPFFDAGPVLTALWIVALLSALVGRWSIGRVALLVSVLAAVLLHPLEALLAPPQFVSLDPRVLTLSATAALITVLGTPRTRTPLVAAAVGWAGLAAVAHAFELLTAIDSTGSPTGFLLGDPARTSWTVALALAVAAVFALARFALPAAALLLSVVPLAAGLEATFIAFDWAEPIAGEVLVALPVVLGVIVLVVTSHRATASGGRVRGHAVAPERRRRSGRAVGVAVPIVILGGTAGALTASGLDWTHPVGMSWSDYWRTTATGPLPDFAHHPDATLTYALPHGGSCTIRVAITDTSSGPRPDRAAADTARAALAEGAADGTLLDRERLRAAIKDNPSRQNTWRNFWGVDIRYGAGTGNYNPDVEYFEAVDATLRSEVLQSVERAGASPEDVDYTSVQRCRGEQR
ncbi:hypothetical protein [Amnibacterium setariae]|uniref:Uncharacterized protein n=1 Tax=Amnibacterium setariae TaxID=2306585 RepID=A0A3A1U2B9_9MICO|nr:hypothetical protein [Amnibacterium setariae]RIX31075.1 hypothetical protein D1781_06805 [Amnibacterium setariae]